MFQRFARLAVATTLIAVAPATAMAQTSFTSFATFLTGLSAIGTDSYDLLPPGLLTGPITRNAGSFGYRAQTTLGAPFDGLFAISNPALASDIWLTTEDASVSLRFDNFDNQVVAIGGRFFSTDGMGAFSANGIRVQATDALGASFDQVIIPNSADSFFGLRFTAAVRSLTLTALNSGFGTNTTTAFFPTVNSLVLGSSTVVPEPSSGLLLCIGLGGLALVIRRRAA